MFELKAAINALCAIPKPPRPRVGLGGSGFRRPWRSNPLNIGRPIAIGATKDIGADENQYRLSVHLQDQSLIGDEDFLSAVSDAAEGEVEFKFVGDVLPSSWNPTSRLRPITAGASISPQGKMAGTLGFMVKRGSHFIGISNNHVLSRDNCRTYPQIIQPSGLDGGGIGDDVGVLAYGVPIKFSKSKYEEPRAINYVDAAAFDVYPNVKVDSSMISRVGVLGGFWSASYTPMEVVKIGRTTGLTSGSIVDIGVGPIWLDYGSGKFAWFDDQLAIRGAEGGVFSTKGDSGSLVVDRNGWGVGLIFADNNASLGGPQPVTYANPIIAVLDALGISY